MITRRRFLERGLKASVAAAILPAGCASRGPRPSYAWVNDVHSRLNRTRVAGTVRPASLDGLVAIVRQAVTDRASLCISGGKHAMGAQQFGTDARLVETEYLSGILDFDAAAGEVEVAAGTQWPQLIAELEDRQEGRPDRFTIIQKQTGADRMSIGGALASNVHGRRLDRAPFVSDVIDVTLVDAAGDIRRCSRSENAELFRLAAGGYGLFGLFGSVRLMLERRRMMERVVEMIDIDDLATRFSDRIDNGYLFGDFQFATDAGSDALLQRGVFACYRPAPLDARPSTERKGIGRQEWLDLVRLAHEDKSRAFERYATHYRETSGQVYGSDELQFGTYVDGYHQILGARSASIAFGTEMITELYVPRDALTRFMTTVRDDVRRHGIDIIYGTVRLIERDDATQLAWARRPWACVVLNLHVTHSPEGLAKARADFQRLIDRAIAHDGTYYLTYHKWATREQVLACHPQIVEFLRAKLKRDPRRVFDSDWHRHHHDMLADKI